MSKVGGALPSWYWPAGISRRVPVPQQPLGRILRQKFKAAAARPAIISGDRTISYAELSEQAAAIAGGLQTVATKNPFAIMESDPADSLLLLLAALFAGRQIFLPQDDGSDVVELMEAAKVEAVLTSAATPSSYNGIRVLQTAELSGNFSEAASARRAKEPCIHLAGTRGIVTHSHFSLSAMAASMAAFIPALRETGFVCLSPSLGSWEVLTGILLALTNGAPVIFDRLGPESPSAPVPAYVILDHAQAEWILAEKRAPDLVRKAPYTFVSTGSFTASWRRSLEALCGAPVFPLWGMAELGPVLSAHPTWLPPHGHGFPLVNISLIPIDPDTGKVSIVPWEMLERAEIAVEALSAMIGYAKPLQNPAEKAGTALRTGQIANMDHVGVVVLQEEAGHHAARA